MRRRGVLILLAVTTLTIPAFAEPWRIQDDVLVLG